MFVGCLALCVVVRPVVFVLLSSIFFVIAVSCLMRRGLISRKFALFENFVLFFLLLQRLFFILCKFAIELLLVVRRLG